jgi:hypothetical protein
MLPGVTESQLAATIAALFGQDYHGAFPDSGAPIVEAITQIPQSPQKASD